MSTKSGRASGPDRGILYVLAKAPAPGAVKTRLVPPLSPAQACDLAGAFASDLVEGFAGLAAGAPLELRLSIDDGDAGPGSLLLRALAARFAIRAEEQGDGDLGERMKRLIERGLAEGRPTILVGTDAPDLPPQRIRDALLALERADVVLGPAADGGYVLVGAKRPVPCLFEIDAPWSSERVFAATCESLRKNGCRFEILAPWEDVDDAAALGRLAFRLESGGRAAAPATAGLIAQWRREGVRF